MFMLSTILMLHMSHSTARVKMHLAATSMEPNSMDHISQKETDPDPVLLCWACSMPVKFLRRCAHLFEEQNTLTSVIIVFITLCTITYDNQYTHLCQMPPR